LNSAVPVLALSAASLSPAIAAPAKPASKATQPKGKS
jgi:hypothetical protein